MAQCLVVCSAQNLQIQNPLSMLDTEDDFEFINHEDVTTESETVNKTEVLQQEVVDEFPEITFREIPYRHQYANDESSFIEFLDYEDSPQWRRKNEARVNAKKKIKNYQVKIIEDHELIRKSLQKWIPSNVLKTIGAVHSMEKDTITFYGNAYDDYAYKVGRKTRNISKYLVPVFVKVWIKPSKEFLQRMKPYYEHDEQFKEIIDSITTSNEFNKLWAQREYENYKKMTGVGIKVPKVLFFDRNVIIYRYSHSKYYEENGPYGTAFQYHEPNSTVLPQPTLDVCIEKLKEEKKLESIFDEVLQIMKDVYNKAGLIHGNLTPKSILEDGCLINIAQSMDIYYPGADELLHQDCRNISEFFSKHGLKVRDSRTENIFEIITGYTFKSGQNQKIDTKINNSNDNIDNLIRKIERKSNRSMQQELTKLS